MRNSLITGAAITALTLDCLPLRAELPPVATAVSTAPLPIGKNSLQHTVEAVKEVSAAQEASMKEWGSWGFHDDQVRHVTAICEALTADLRAAGRLTEDEVRNLSFHATERERSAKVLTERMLKAKLLLDFGEIVREGSSYLSFQILALEPQDDEKVQRIARTIGFPKPVSVWNIGSAVVSTEKTSPFVTGSLLSSEGTLCVVRSNPGLLQAAYARGRDLDLSERAALSYEIGSALFDVQEARLREEGRGPSMTKSRRITMRHAFGRCVEMLMVSDYGALTLSELLTSRSAIDSIARSIAVGSVPGSVIDRCVQQSAEPPSHRELSNLLSPYVGPFLKNCRDYFELVGFSLPTISKVQQ